MVILHLGAEPERPRRWVLKLRALLGWAERLCSWCGAHIGYIRGTRGLMSHGMCQQCSAEWNDEEV